MHPDLDELDAMLSAASPPVEPMADARLRASSDRARKVATREVGARRRGVLATSGVVVLVLAGAGAAVAAPAVLSWLEAPVATIEYTLPSGERCSFSVGDVQARVPEQQEDAEAAAVDWGRRTDLSVVTTSLAAVYVGFSHAGKPFLLTGPGGTAAPGLFGTEEYDPDYEYSQAMWTAASSLLDAEYARLGYRPEERPLLAGYAECG